MAKRHAALGITGTIVIVYIWYERKTILRFLFARDLPETPEDWAPRYRTWKNGTEIVTDEAIELLHQLDGTTRSAVKLLTGATDGEIDCLGGING